MLLLFWYPVEEEPPEKGRKTSFLLLLLPEDWFLENTFSADSCDLEADFSCFSNLFPNESFSSLPMSSPFSFISFLAVLTSVRVDKMSNDVHRPLCLLSGLIKLCLC